MKKFLATALLIGAFALPLSASAYPFGGMIGQIIFCYNNAIYAAVGPPRGGPFIWTPSTRTYQFGPPQRVGQWLLGLAAPPYYCLVSIQPIIVWSGILMTMEGSSGPAAPGFPGGGGFTPTPSPFPSPSPTPNPTPAPPTTPSGINHLVVSEVYYRADSMHGGRVQDQWIEIYNPTNASIDISRWQMRSTSTSQALPVNTTIPARGYILFAGSSDVRTLWTVPAATQVIAFPAPFAGFNAAGDHVYLQNTSGTRIDAMSWGSDVSGFSPSAPTVQLGHGLIRKNLVADTDTAQDWVDTAAPNPGR